MNNPITTPLLPPVWDEIALAAAVAKEAQGVNLRNQGRSEREHRALHRALEEVKPAVGSALACLESCWPVRGDDEACQAYLASLLANDPGGLRYTALRYMVYPMISRDDLKTALDAPSLSAQYLSSPAGRKVCGELIRFLLAGMDDHRFPWLRANKGPPSPARRTAGIDLTAFTLVSRQNETGRRSDEKKELEQRYATTLKEAGYVQIPTCKIANSADLHAAIKPGEMMKECTVCGENADFVVCLRDNRFLFIECKASNSALNSRKRVNKEAVKNIQVWKHQLGAAIIGACAIRGVFDARYIQEAQTQGVFVFWDHDHSDLTNFLSAVDAAVPQLPQRSSPRSRPG